MLHACAARFDVTGNLEKFCELNKACVSPASHILMLVTHHSSVIIRGFHGLVYFQKILQN